MEVRKRGHPPPGLRLFATYVGSRDVWTSTGEVDDPATGLIVVLLPRNGTSPPFLYLLAERVIDGRSVL